MTSTQATALRQVLQLDISSKLTNEITWNFSCGYSPPNWRTSFWFHCYRRNRLVSRPLSSLIKDLRFLHSRLCTNFNIQFQFGLVSGNVLNQYTNWKMFRNKEKTNYSGLEVKRSGHKSVTMAIIYNLVVCIHIQSFKWFCWLISKICLTLRLSGMLLAWVDVITTSLAYYKKINNSRTKIDI